MPRGGDPRERPETNEPGEQTKRRVKGILKAREYTKHIDDVWN